MIKLCIKFQTVQFFVWRLWSKTAVYMSPDLNIFIYVLNEIQYNEQQHCLSIEGKSHENTTHRHAFLLLWPCPWPDDYLVILQM